MNEKVTVWIGNFESNDELENYTNVKYTEDGDSIPSIFEQRWSLEKKAGNEVKNIFMGLNYNNGLNNEITDVL